MAIQGTCMECWEEADDIEVPVSQEGRDALAVIVAMCEEDGDPKPDGVCGACRADYNALAGTQVTLGYGDGSTEVGTLSGGLGVRL